jgi:hypothetical protein
MQLCFFLFSTVGIQGFAGCHDNSFTDNSFNDNSSTDNWFTDNWFTEIEAGLLRKRLGNRSWMKVLYIRNRSWIYEKKV